MSSRPAVEILSIDGAWILCRAKTGETWPAVVPGCVHVDLSRAGLLPALDWRDNEALQQWIDGEAWIYRRTFDLREDQLSAVAAELVCEGLDTVATVLLNGQVVVQADNMYRTWRCAVEKYLRPGENTIEVRFDSTLTKIAEGQAKRPLREWNIYFDRHAGRGYVRKMACSFGWDWGPIAPTAGIWKNIRLEFVRAARWLDIQVRQEHGRDQCALKISWQTSGPGNVRLELRNEGALVAEAVAVSSDGNATLVVKDPALWWPNTLGPQPLYEFSAVLTDASGRQDVWECRIGLRSLRLVRERDEVGESFGFEINGRPMFCKGANWVPARILPSEITREDCRSRLQDAIAANMNMLRVWGGGLYESDDFYDLCDEMGILVWQDFMFACGVYPSWDDAFLANVEGEARDNIRRLRHHPSLALWCGNNELEQGIAGRPNYTWEEYGRLFDQLLPRLCAELDPDTAYWPSSPHSPLGDRNDFGSDRWGDTHHWSVFFDRKPIESQRNWRTRFMSEYGFQSFPELRTVESFTAPEDRHFMSRILDYHQRSEVGNQTIFSYLLDWFPAPLHFADLLTLSQITQSLCVRYAAEHLRRLQPLCAGVLYWQLNDLWPCASWSSVDSSGRWKALQYDARRFFAPILISIEEDVLTKRARIHVSNQSPLDKVLAARWQVTDTDGTVLLEGHATAKIPSQSGHYFVDLDAAPLLKKHHAHDLMIWAWALEDELVVSRNWAPLARPKHLSLAAPNLRADVESTPTGTVIHLACDKPAPYIVLSLKDDDLWLDDNFLHLHPGESRTIRVSRGPATEVIRQQLSLRSLADWMPVRPATDALAPKPTTYDLQRKR